MKITLSKSLQLDALIVGGGVAGCAAALELCAHALTVGVLHRNDEAPGYESIPPRLAHRLASLVEIPAAQFSNVIAWWGSDASSLMPTFGARIVQRKDVSRALRELSKARGAVFFETDRPLQIQKSGEQWRLQCVLKDRTALTISSRFAVDASGRACIVSRSAGARRMAVDSVCSLGVKVNVRGKIGTWTEAVADGWWNLCANGHEGTLSFQSLPSIIRSARRNPACFFSRTRHLPSFVTGRIHWATARVRPCGSSCLSQIGGEGWTAVGDAARTVQPLASAGISNAFRDASSVYRSLITGSERFDRLRQDEFTRYLTYLGQHYALETRWSQSLFWKMAQSVRQAA